MSELVQIVIIACALMCIPAQRQQPPEIKLLTPSDAGATMISKNGKVVAAVCKDHKLRVWSLPDAHLFQTFDVSDRQLAGAAISDDGHWVLYADYKGVVTVWDSATGRVSLQQGLDRYLLAAAFSHDSQRLAIAPGGRPVRIIDVASNRTLKDLEDIPTTTNGLAFSRDGELIAFGDRDGLRIYSVRTGALISRNADSVAEPLATDFTRDGTQVLAAGGDKVVLFIQTLTGKTLRRLGRTAEVPTYLEVSPNGTELAAVTLKSDNMDLPAPVIVWELASFQQEIEWMPPSGVLGVTWTQDGHFIAATATPDALHLWRLR